jgi:hypothetical protein
MGASGRGPGEQVGGAGPCLHFADYAGQADPALRHATRQQLTPPSRSHTCFNSSVAAAFKALGTSHRSPQICPARPRQRVQREMVDSIFLRSPSRHTGPSSDGSECYIFAFASPSSWNKCQPAYNRPLNKPYTHTSRIHRKSSWAESSFFPLHPYHSRPRLSWGS